MEMGRFILPDIQLEEETNLTISQLERYGLDRKDLITKVLQCRLDFGANEGLACFTEKVGSDVAEAIEDEEAHTGMVNEFVSEVYISVCSLYEEVCLSLQVPIDTIEVNLHRFNDAGTPCVLVLSQQRLTSPLVVYLMDSQE